MGRERDNEKKFNEYLNRILAGEEIKIDPSLDAELRAALDFARKMAQLRKNPSAQFRARLKASLLQKLETQQAQKVREQSEKTSFWAVFRSHPAWQGAVAVLLVIIALAVVWRTGVFQPSPFESVKATRTPAATTTAPSTKAPAATTTAGYFADVAAPVSIDAKTDKAAYNPGEEVKIELTMRNVSQKQLNVEDFPPILSVMQEDTKQPVYTFTAGTAIRTLPPNAVATYTYTWRQVDFKGSQVTGRFYIELEDLEYNGLPVKLVLNSPVYFEIRSSPLY